MNQEEWKVIPNTKGLYEISNYGRIKSNPRLVKTTYGKYYSKTNILRCSKNQKGYLIFDVKINKRIMKQVHRLVGEMFIENPHNKPQINHKDGNKNNNHVDNLEWVTNEENMRHAYATGLQYNAFGKEARNHKYTYRCLENQNIKNMTAREIAIYINDNIKCGINVISTASNIRTRLKAFGLTFESEVVQNDNAI